MSNLHTQTDESDQVHFIQIRIPGSTYPPNSEKTYEDLLYERLQESNLGEVTGGGSPIDGPEFRDIDVDVTYLEEGLDFLRNELSCLKAPPGTKLYYDENGRELEERLLENGRWELQE